MSARDTITLVLIFVISLFLVHTLRTAIGEKTEMSVSRQK